jgi:hypothetical protein
MTTNGASNGPVLFWRAFASLYPTVRSKQRRPTVPAKIRAVKKIRMLRDAECSVLGRYSYGVWMSWQFEAGQEFETTQIDFGNAADVPTVHMKDGRQAIIFNEDFEIVEE